MDAADADEATMAKRQSRRMLRGMVICLAGGDAKDAVNMENEEEEMV